MRLPATLLWAMSPTMPTRSPSNLPKCRLMVRASSSAWVGCSLAPSPALTTGRPSPPLHQFGHAFLGMTDHEDVGADRPDGEHGVAE